MEFSESGLTFVFEDNCNVIKFDDSDYYRKNFNNLYGGKGVDFIVNSTERLQLIEVKNCKGFESQNAGRVAVSNRKSENDEVGFDIEIAQKVAMTLACLLGAKTKEKLLTEQVREILPFYKSLVARDICDNQKPLLVILVLEGEFHNSCGVTRTNEMVMKRIQDSINKQLKWLNCRVSVVNTSTYNAKCFKIVT